MNSQWRLPTIFDYWDERSRSVSRLSLQLDDVPDNEKEQAATSIAEAVVDIVGAIEDDALKQVGAIVADDLYKAASAIEFWSDSLVLFLQASAGTFFGCIRDRGFLVHYAVDNTFPDLVRPLSVYGPWFSACGMSYICPQHLAVKLMENDGVNPDAFADRMSDYVAEGRDVAGQFVERCVDQRRHFVYLEIDYQEGSFAATQAVGSLPGVIDVFRNEPPIADSNIVVRLPDDPASLQ